MTTDWHALVPWWYVVVALWAGSALGYLAAALCAAAGRRPLRRGDRVRFGETFRVVDMSNGQPLGRWAEEADRLTTAEEWGGAYRAEGE